MYENYLSKSLNISETIANELMSGSNMFHQNTNNGTKQIFKVVNNGENISRQDIITQDLVHGPFAFIINPLHLTNFDPELVSTIDEGIFHLGGIVIGSFDKIEFPVWNCNEKTLYGDIISSMFILAMNGDLNTAMSYLRASQLISSLNTNIPLTHIDAEELRTVRQISLNRL